MWRDHESILQMEFLVKKGLRYYKADAVYDAVIKQESQQQNVWAVLKKWVLVDPASPCV